MSFGFGFGFPKRLTSGGGLSPRLYLDFIGTGVLPSTVTFSRGTNATLTGSNGLIQWAPHNLLTNSESFEAAAWTRSGLNTTGTPPWVNVAVAPDGTTTAERLIEDTSTGTHQIYVLPGLGINTYTRTIYAKANGRTQFELTQESGGNARFTLTGAGTAVALGSNTVSIQALDNGWYRCSSTFTVTGIFGLYLVLYNGSTTNYTGDGTSGIFIWGAQLNIGSTAQSYNSTTPKNLLGFTQEPENAAWTKSNSYVQQNLLTWSQDFDNAAWNKASGAAATLNTAIAPDGTTTADTLNTSAAGSYVGQTLTVNGSHVFSVYLKRLDNDWVIVGNNNAVDKNVWFNLSTGVRGTQLNATGEIQPVGNGWYRCSVIHTATNANPSIFNIEAVAADNSGVRQGSVYAWGAQLVQGSTAGDYTQTTSAAAPTRYVNWDGTLTGRKLVENTAAAEHFVIAANVTLGAANTLCTSTVYVKAAERTRLQVRAYSNGSPIAQASFNISTLQFSSISGGTWAYQDAGGGWYRISVVATHTNAFGNGIGVFLIDAGGALFYTGDGTSGIYVSDFQLSNSASVDPYVYNPQAAAASAAYYGPRFDYDPVTLAAKGLLIEEQRTNLLTYSEQFDNVGVWPRTNSSVTANASVAPDGTTTADFLQEDTATGTHNLVESLTFLATTYTASVYVRKTSTRNAMIYMFMAGTFAGGVLNVTNGTSSVFAGSVGGTTTSVVDAGTYWRVTVTAAMPAGAGSVNVYTMNGSTASYTGDGTSGIFIWGAQLEAGSFATSYIPTVASQVTRNADSASMLGDNFYTWYNPNQGTLYAEYSRPFLDATRPSHYVNINDNTSNNAIIAYSNVSQQTQGDTLISGASQGIVTSSVSVTANTTMKQAYAVKTNSLILSVNGTLSSEDTSASLPGVSQMNIGNRPAGDRTANSCFRRIGYYNTRLPDSTLQALTT